MTRTAIRPDHKFQISENGSLLILGIETSSNLTCEATNGVGIGISKSIHVTVIGTVKKFEVVFSPLLLNVKQSKAKRSCDYMTAAAVWNKINGEMMSRKLAAVAED